MDRLQTSRVRWLAKPIADSDGFCQLRSQREMTVAWARLALGKGRPVLTFNFVAEPKALVAAQEGVVVREWWLRDISQALVQPPLALERPNVELARVRAARSNL